MKNILTSSLLLSTFLTIGQANSELPITGVGADNEGVFAHSHYPTNFGHLIPSPYDAFGNDTAYYYLSSSDYGNVNPASSAGMHGTGSLTGFTELASALNYYGKTNADITVQFDGMSLGLDRQGEEWDLKNDIETRIYAGGTFAILYSGDTILTGKMPEIDMTIDYNSELTPFDDQVSAESHFVAPSLVLNGIAETDSIAKALYNGSKDYGLKFEFSSIQPAGQTEYRTNDLVGAFFEIPSGSLKTGNVLIPNLGNEISSCVGSTETLDAGTFDSYIWNDQSTNQTLDVTVSGIYDVTVTKTGINYTSEPVDVTMDLCTSTKAIQTTQLNIFPNPAKSNLQVKGNFIANYSIHTITGEIVKKGSLNTVPHQIDISDLNPGIYIFKSNGLQSKFIKK